MSKTRSRNCPGSRPPFMPWRRKQLDGTHHDRTVGNLAMRSTTPGQHRPVLLKEILEVLAPRPGEIVVDCTVGWGGHSAELLRSVGRDGLLIGLDLDSENVDQA